MKILSAERPQEVSHNVRGGDGFITSTLLLSQTELGEHCRLFNEVRLHPGHSIGMHPHDGESETYYILSGSGTYSDNDEEYRVSAGDVLYCGDGSTHGIANTGDDDLVFIALILMK